MARKKQTEDIVGETVLLPNEKPKTETKQRVAKPKVITVSGKRKTSIAKATIKSGEGEVRINKRPLEAFSQLRRLYLMEPIRIAEGLVGDQLKGANIQVNVAGGGNESQTEASRLAIAKAIVAFTNNKELKSAYVRYDRSLLVADVRRKEMRKPGDSKARKRRQTSYR